MFEDRRARDSRAKMQERHGSKWLLIMRKGKRRATFEKRFGLKEKKKEKNLEEERGDGKNLGGIKSEFLRIEALLM
ncbi:hypothetical protein OWV82_011893 [Melia azedarach]|uniref:Uncharacterized protein n=1 Tax=Melia azedarach TaxID=155640 RepID=A0ACC1XZJ3_MELAZ|nr:hypothetical protein OWV82_011893 [Melia azedarach]